MTDWQNNRIASALANENPTVMIEMAFIGDVILASTDWVYETYAYRGQQHGAIRTAIMNYLKGNA